MKFWGERMPFLARFAGTHRVLQLGKGHEHDLGISVDRLFAVRPTVVADLSRGLPFRSDSFDAVYAFSIVEHLGDFFQFARETHRVLRKGGFAAILTPHFANDASFVDPSHVLHLSARSFDYFVEGSELFESYGFYSTVRFRIQRRLVMLEQPWSWLPLLQRLVNSAVEVYERHFCYVVRPRGLYIELEAVKDGATLEDP